MKVRVRLTALASAVLLSAAGIAMTAQPANAAIIVGARVCLTSDTWTFTPQLGITPVLGGTAVGAYTANCPLEVGVQATPPFLVTGTQGPYVGSTTYNYYGDCVLAALLGGSATVGGGIIIGGIVTVTAGTSAGTFNNVAVKVLLPDASKGSDICSEADANGLGVTVGTLP
jgi:hypothetical protein